MKLLVHTCCAPCLAGALPKLKALGEVSLFFYNPNIHPLVEFHKRLRAFQVFAEREQVPATFDEEYGLHKFLSMKSHEKPGRCRSCYNERLMHTAKKAKETGADAFTSTLLVGIYQDHDLLRAAGEEASKETGIPFIYTDLRSTAPDGLAIAKQFSLYRQQYCGCIFSEGERFGGKKPEVLG